MLDGPVACPLTASLVPVISLQLLSKLAVLLLLQGTIALLQPRTWSARHKIGEPAANPHVDRSVLIQDHVALVRRGFIVPAASSRRGDTFAPASAFPEPRIFDSSVRNCTCSGNFLSIPHLRATACCELGGGPREASG